MSDAKKTIKVRIAVAVDEYGNWNSSGWKTANCAPAGDREVMGNALEFLDVGGAEACYWVTAELPLPIQGEIAGTVEAAP
jgi:hypothetical protein